MILGINGIITAGKNVIKTLSDNLIAVYEAQNNTNDSLGVINGTPIGGLTYSTGKNGQAFTGNGSNAYVSVPTDSWNSTIGGDFSVSVWVNLTNVSTQQAIISNLSSISGQFQGWDLRVQSGIPRFNLWRGDVASLNSSTTIVANTWYHIVITRKAGVAMNIYVNNSKTTTNSFTNDPIINATHYPTICALQYNTTKALYLSNNSKIDSVNLWNRELSDLEVAELYNSGAGKFYPY
jgi:hypothetical protein